MSRLSAVVIVFALALLALGAYDVMRDKGEVGGDAPASPSASAPAAVPASGVDLTAVQAPLGTVVTSAGATLYRFDKDTPKPPKSNCAGACATTWPPLLAIGGSPRVSGVEQSLVGTVAREDGSQQVTLNGWPLYRFSKDTPGATNGEGVGGTWRAIAPTGKPAVAAAPK
jgi:predicted lipoprotein with Yx(FWY)xxD motif